MINTCTEYIVGLICELERRKQDSKSSKRALELASYFTNFKLQPTHRAIALRSAMVLAVQAKNFALASKFASELLEIQSSGQAAENVSILSDFFRTRVAMYSCTPYIAT